MANLFIPVKARTTADCQQADIAEVESQYSAPCYQNLAAQVMTGSQVRVEISSRMSRGALCKDFAHHVSRCVLRRFERHLPG